MSLVRRAVIDIGTNSVKLLVAEVSGHQVTPLYEKSRQTRLGEGFYEDHVLRPEPMAKTALAVQQFVEKARAYGAVSIRAFATSAARDAQNAADLLDTVETASGLRPEIISGDQEADWAFQGVTSDPALADCPLLLMEVGGGSTQFILGHGSEKHFRQSFQVGTVRLLETLPHSDPPKREELDRCRTWLRSWFHQEVRPALEPAMRKEVDLDPAHGAVQLVGTGGTASILARIDAALEEYDREKMEAVRLSADRLHGHLNLLWSLSLAERQKIPGLPPNRADVMLNGAAVYEAIMDEFEIAEMRVSTRGLRFGAVMAAVS